MTYTDCFITLEGLEDHRDARNPEPFRKRLPHTDKNGHYWAPAIVEFAEVKGLNIHWVYDNSTPEIVLTAAELEEFLLPIYGKDSEFFRAVVTVINPNARYIVYGDDF